MTYVSFDNANQLSLKEIEDMNNDGYEFVVSDGKIIGVMVPVPTLSE